jgi:hypothetical protein
MQNFSWQQVLEPHLKYLIGCVAPLDDSLFDGINVFDHQYIILVINVLNLKFWKWRTAWLVGEAQILSPYPDDGSQWYDEYPSFFLHKIKFTLTRPVLRCLWFVHSLLISQSTWRTLIVLSQTIDASALSAWRCMSMNSGRTRTILVSWYACW